MKHLYLRILIISLFCSLGYAQVKQGFTIDGNIKGLRNGSKLCIIIKRAGKLDTVGRAVAQNGSFKFKNVKLPVHPDFYLICIQTEFVENLQLFLDQGRDIKIVGDLALWPMVAITGSKTHHDFIKGKQIQKKVWDEDFAIKYPDRMGTPDTLIAYSKKSMLAVMDQMPNSSYLPVMIVTWKHPAEGYGIVTTEMKEPFYDRLSEAQKDSHYGKILAQQIVDYRRSRSWIVHLEKSVVNLNSISGSEVLKQLLETANKSIAVTISPVSVKQLTTSELEAKSKAATVILNMGFRSAGDSLTRTNPTTAYVIDESGICVTNYHVGKEYSSKAPYQSLSVMTADGKSYPVTKILSCSESDDLLVFKVETKGDKLVALPLGNKLPEEQSVHVMGHPLGKFYQFTSGIVSGYSTSTLAGKPCNIMNITADFNVGSSGGPIVDGYGNVVGTVSRIDGGMKVGIPVSELKKLIEFKKGKL